MDMAELDRQALRALQKDVCENCDDENVTLDDFSMVLCDNCQKLEPYKSALLRASEKERFQMGDEL